MMRNHTLGPCYRKVRDCRKIFVHSMALLACIPVFQLEYKRLLLKTEIQKVTRCSATAMNT